MAAFNEAMRRIAEEEGLVEDRFRQIRREVFEDFYPKLTDEDIEQALEPCAYFGEVEVRIIQSFYRTTSYQDTVEELQLAPGNPRGEIRQCLLQAYRQLSGECPLRTALQMAYNHRNIRKSFA